MRTAHRRILTVNALALPMALGMLLSLVPVMHFTEQRVQRESLRLKEVRFSPVGSLYVMDSRSLLARIVRIEENLDVNISPPGWRYVLLRSNPDGVIEWFENDTRCRRYEPADVATFTRAFTATYRPVANDTNSILTIELKVAPNRPMEEMIRFQDLLDMVSNRNIGIVVTPYNDSSLFSIDPHHYKSLLEQQPCYTNTCGNAHRPNVNNASFIKQSLYGEAFETVLDILNPPRTIKTESGLR